MRKNGVQFLMVAIIVCINTVWTTTEAGPATKAKTSQDTRLYLVGVGSGDPDNITLRAVNVIKKSDVIFCSDWTKKGFTDLLKDKEIYDAGFGIFGIYGKKPEKAKKNKRFNYEEKMKEFEEIDKIIRKSIKAGKTVSILDNGDVTIYGPHMWYMEAFEDLNPQIVPGLSSFNAANAALKKSVTSGKETHSVILTASFGKGEGDYKGSDSIEKLAASKATMVFFTMFLDIDEVVKKLLTHYPPQTPIAIVEFAGYKEKETVIQGTLKNIKSKLPEGKLPFEHLIYVGDFLTNRYKNKEK